METFGVDGSRVDSGDWPVIQAFCVPPIKALVVELDRLNSFVVLIWALAACILVKF